MSTWPEILQYLGPNTRVLKPEYSSTLAGILEYFGRITQIPKVKYFQKRISILPQTIVSAIRNSSNLIMNNKQK